MQDVITLLALAAPLALIWLFVVRPTQRRSRAADELNQSLQVGQRVMTTSGLIGVVAGLDDDTVQLVIAAGVTVEFARRAVATLIPDPGADQAEGEGEDEDEDPTRR